MSDCVRIIISIAAQLRVVRALGPSALVLVGVPVSGPARPTPSRAHREEGSGTAQPKNGHKART